MLPLEFIMVIKIPEYWNTIPIFWNPYITMNCYFSFAYKLARDIPSFSAISFLA